MAEYFSLSDGERQSAVWMRLERYFTERLADLRHQNDHPSKDMIATTLLRGQIKEIQGILALGQTVGPK